MLQKTLETGNTTQEATPETHMLVRCKNALEEQLSYEAIQKAVLQLLLDTRKVCLGKISYQCRMELERAMYAYRELGYVEPDSTDILTLLKECVHETFNEIKGNQSEEIHTITIQTLLICIVILECGKDEQATTDVVKRLLSKTDYSEYLLYNEDIIPFGKFVKAAIRSYIRWIKRAPGTIVNLCKMAYYGMMLPIATIPIYVAHKIERIGVIKRSNVYAELIGTIYEQAAMREGKDPQPVLDFLSPGNRDRIDSAIIYATGFPYLEKGEEHLMDPDLPNVIIHGVGEDCLELARELDRQGGCNVVMVDNRKMKIANNGISIRGGVMYVNGKTYSVNFSKPIMADYLYGHRRSTGSSYAAKGNHTPTSGCEEVSLITKNKEIGRKVISDAGYNNVPYICWNREGDEGKHWQKKMKIEYQYVITAESIIKVLENFCAQNNCREIVVKPSNASRGYGVKFFKDMQLSEAEIAIREIQNKGYGVIVEKRIIPAPLEIDGEVKDWNLRVFVTRDEENQEEPVVGDIVVRVDTPGVPVNISISAKVMTLPDVLEKMNIPEEKARKLMRDIDDFSKNCFHAIKTFVMDTFKKDPKIDLLGIDLIISEENGELTVNLIEVNDDASGGMYDLSKILPSEEQGRGARKLATCMIKRATAHRDKRCKTLTKQTL